ncbi:MAG: clostripain-related cysteine peptidase [Armatimonadota bacterium]
MSNPRLWAVLSACGAAVGLLLTGCGGSGGPGGGTWTVLVYMNGDNDLEAALIGDFNEMEREGPSPRVKVLVQLDRHPSYDTSNGNWTSTRRYRIVRDTTEPPAPPNSPHNHTIVSDLLADLGELNMGHEDTLVDFATWGIDLEPADKYLLIIADHGQGWRPASLGALGVGIRGVSRDDTSLGDWLTNAELKSAMQRVETHLGRNVDILALDASEMSLLEIAYQVRQHCDYTIASQLSEPNDGYPFDALLDRLTSGPGQTPETFLGGFVSDYIASYAPGAGPNGAGSSVTIAAYRSSQLAGLAAEVSSLGQLLRAELPGQANNLLTIRGNTQRFTSSFYRDLYDFADRVQAFFADADIDQACQNIKDAIGPGPSHALVAEGHATGSGINVDDAHGICVYLPDDARTYNGTYATSVDFATDTQWDEYISDTSGLP